jgi:thiosulfate/3-mercaptopyruvate sulfurtransferase
MVTVDTKWLASHLDDSDIIILDTRGTMAYRFGHIKNSLPIDIGQVIFIA